MWLRILGRGISSAGYRLLCGCIKNFWCEGEDAGDARLQATRGCCKLGKELAPQPCSLLSPNTSMDTRLVSEEHSF